MKQLIRHLIILLLSFIQLVATQEYCLRNFTYGSNVYSIVIKDDDLFVGGNSPVARQWKLSDKNYQLGYAAGETAQYIVSTDTQIFIGSRVNGTKQFNIGSDKSVAQFPNNGTLMALAIGGNDFLFTAHSDGTISQWEIGSRKIIRLIANHTNFASDLAVNGDSLFIVRNTDTVTQWSISGVREMKTFKAANTCYYAVASADDFVFAAGGLPFTVFQWRVSSGAFVQSFIGHSAEIKAMEASGNYLFTGSDDKTIIQWEISSASQVRRLTGHLDSIYALAIGQNGSLFSGSFDTLVKQWFIPELNGTAVSKKSVTSNSFIATSLSTTTTMATNLSTGILSPAPINDSLVNLVNYLVVGGVATIALLTIVLAITFKLHVTASQQQHSSSLANNNNSSAARQKTIIKGKIRPSVIALFLGGYQSKRAKLPMPSEASIEEFINIHPSNNRLLKQPLELLLAVTPPPLTDQQQGQHVPGHYLMGANEAVYQQINCIYTNRNCKVYCCQALDRELCKRTRTKWIAVKTMTRLDAQLIDAFYQEVSLMFNFVGKPNFVQLVGFCDSPFQIVTDYYALGSLEQALIFTRSILPTKRIAISFSLQISSALQLMHGSGFAHCDLKALNVFVDRNADGNLICYLGDFGFSQVLDDKDLVVNALKVFNMKGLTVAYVAPEVLLRFNTRSDEQTMKTLNWQAKDFKRADVYSLSLLLYEIMVCNSAWGN